MDVYYQVSDTENAQPAPPTLKVILLENCSYILKRLEMELPSWWMFIIRYPIWKMLNQLHSLQKRFHWKIILIFYHKQTRNRTSQLIDAYYQVSDTENAQLAPLTPKVIPLENCSYILKKLKMELPSWWMFIIRYLIWKMLNQPYSPKVIPLKES